LSEINKFLPHNTMLVRYMLSLCVRPSVCHKSWSSTKMVKPRITIQRHTIAQGF